MREPPRRRRDEDTAGGLPLFPLVLVVILAGLLLGGVLAHFFGGGAIGAPKALPTVVAVVASPSPEISEEPTPPPIAATTAPSASPTTSPSAAPTSKPTPPPTPKPTPSPSPASKPKPTATPTPRAAVPTPTPRPLVARPTVRPAVERTPAPVKPAAVANAENPAASIVRSYLEALERGDRAAANAYLASGNATETFMSPDSQIASLRSTALGDSAYRVTADVKNPGAEYYITFTLEPGPGGLQITDHYAIKPQ